MIIDVHSHIVVEDWLPEKWWRSVADLYIKTSGEFGFRSYEEVYRKKFAALWDPETEKLIADMDGAGIDKSVILPLDFGLAMGEAAVSIEEQNKRIAELRAERPDRLIAFVGVDPRRKNAVEVVRKGIQDYGMKGVKLHPGCGFYPNEKTLDGLLKMVEEMNVPVVFHTGHASQPLRSKYCRPIYLDDVLVRFPNLRLIAAHLGGGWHEELFWMGITKPNLFVDISSWQRICVQSFPRFCTRLREAIDMFGMHRVLFGTDAPFLNSVCTQKKFIEIIAGLPSTSPPGITFRKSEIQALLGENARRLLGLE